MDGNMFGLRGYGVYSSEYWGQDDGAAEKLTHRTRNYFSLCLGMALGDCTSPGECGVWERCGENSLTRYRLVVWRR